MLDVTQTLLIVVITVLTILLAVVGVQVFFILKEMRHTMRKTNKILDDTSAMTNNFRRPFSSITSLASGIKTGLEIISTLRQNREKEK